MIDEVNDPAQPMVTDPFSDTGPVREWLEQSDGPLFMEALGDVHGATVLDVGVGTGRVAKKILEHGCVHLLGIDVSPETVLRARHNLSNYRNVEIRQADIAVYQPEPIFNLAYLVWTIFHIDDKPRALANIARSLRPGGRLVVSVERVDEWLDYGPRRIQQFPITAEELICLLEACGWRIQTCVPVYDAMAGGHSLLTTIIAAESA